MDRSEFAALDTLQYGLARDAERAHRLARRQEVLAGITIEAILEVFGEANTPRAPGVSWSPAIMPSLSRRWIVDGATPSTTAARLIVISSPSGTSAIGSKQGMPQWRRRLPTRPGEAMTVHRGPPLTIEDAGDHTVGVMRGEPAQQRDRVLVGADGGRPRARQSEVDVVERAAFPAQREMGGRLVAVDLDRDVFNEGAQQLLPVARRGCLRVPDDGEIGSEREETIALGLRDHPRPLSFAALQLSLGRLKRAQAFLPVAFKAARHQPVIGVDGAIAALGALRFVIGSLDPEPPLLQSDFAFGFQPLSGGKGGGKPSRLQGSDEGPSDGLVDLDAADIETIDATVLDENLARAVVTWRGVATTIVGVQTATAMTTAGQPLQECAALPYGAARMVRSGLCIAGDAFLVCLIGLPVNEARMMLRDQHLPFGAREVSHALLAPAVGIEDDLVAGSAIDVSAGIDGVGEDLVDGGIARLDPSDLGALMHP